MVNKEFESEKIPTEDFVIGSIHLIQIGVETIPRPRRHPCTIYTSRENPFHFLYVSRIYSFLIKEKYFIFVFVE